MEYFKEEGKEEGAKNCHSTDARSGYFIRLLRSALLSPKKKHGGGDGKTEKTRQNGMDILKVVGFGIGKGIFGLSIPNYQMLGSAGSCSKLGWYKEIREYQQ